jgi:transcriptional regulator
MYVPAHFAWTDAAALHDFLRHNVFAAFAGIIGGEVHFAHVPIVLDAEPAPLGAVKFHFARANPLSRIEDGANLKFSILGAHSYISPDWYENTAQVPTWNYIAVEGSGPVRRMSEEDSRHHLETLAAREEAALAPKTPWTIERVDPERLAKMLSAIVGFHLVFERLEGKAKLSQNRSEADRRKVIAALEAQGDPGGRDVARAMRERVERPA